MDPAGARQRLVTARLYVLLTRALCRRDPEETLAALLAGGVDLVQVREKPFGPDGPAWVARVCEICAPHGVPVIVNDEPALAGLADGLHLGREDLQAFPEGALRRRSGLLGLSTHGPEDLARALSEDPDYLAIGPWRPTRTKGYRAGLPVEKLSAVAAVADRPLFAIGGIDAENLPALVALGIGRIAVCSALLQAADPAAAAARLKALLPPLDAD